MYYFLNYAVNFPGRLLCQWCLMSLGNLSTLYLRTVSCFSHGVRPVMVFLHHCWWISSSWQLETLWHQLLSLILSISQYTVLFFIALEVVWSHYSCTFIKTPENICVWGCWRAQCRTKCLDWDGGSNRSSEKITSWRTCFFSSPKNFFHP